MNEIISVVICTYNRSRILANALETLCQQTLSASLYEIIVVDNNSIDDTNEIVKGFQKKNPNIQYVFESTQGLSHARNRGWKEARGNYVAYVDDDCKVPIKWLEVAIKIIEEKNVAVFGGPYFPYYESIKPYWFKDSYRSKFDGDVARELNVDEYLSGGNIVFLKSILYQFGGFDTDFGMVGSKRAFGEETDLIRRIRKIMPDQIIYYDPEFFVYHLVPTQKTKLRWYIQHQFVDGRFSYKVFNDQPDLKNNSLKILVRLFFTLFRFMWDFFWGTLTRNKKQFPYIQNYLYERAFRHIGTLGNLYENLLNYSSNTD